jgi:hypothetical protein
MKKLILLVALLFVPALVWAHEQEESLLATDGTLYTVTRELRSAHREINTEAMSFLQLTIRRGDTIATEVVPATLASGSHINPAIAYDSGSNMLFVFWIRQVTLMHSELLFASRDKDGVWSEPTAIGGPFDYRENLRIAVTRRVSEADGTLSQTTGISVHAVWWEFDTHTGTEAAQYAMLTIENGNVEAIDRIDLSEFTHDPEEAAVASVSMTSADGGADEKKSVLKQPVIFASPKQDSVLVVFGDFATQRLNEVRIRPSLPPVSNGRLRVPVGRREGGVIAPNFATAMKSGRVDGINNDDRLAFYTQGEDKISYVVLRDGKWSSVGAIVLDAQITSSDAVEAIRRLLNEN